MSERLQDKEDKPRRQRFDQHDAGILYIRYYYTSPDTLAIVPAEGDPMPGSPPSLLGPFVERGGISNVQKPKSGEEQVCLRCRLLKAR